jgi:hypothetical protein
VRVHFPLQFREPPRAVALLILLDAVHVEETQQQVAGGDRLPVVCDVTVSFQTTVCPANEEMRHVVVLVLI